MVKLDGIKINNLIPKLPTEDRAVFLSNANALRFAGTSKKREENIES